MDLRIMQLYVHLLLVLTGIFVSPLSIQFRKHKFTFKEKGSVDPGKPLFLTPYLKNGQLEQAQEMSMVNLLGRTSYAGFFTVNETYNSNMYFWFFPAQNGNSSAPILLWLQGGPGGSSLFGLFNENGPIVVDKDGNADSRTITWNSIYHMIYIDNPVGTGFSFSDKQGYSVTEEQIADNLYSCLVQFFTVFFQYQKNEFYLTGESYAGKYIPAIGYKIHMANQNNPVLKINLKGMAIGDGLCDPENMVNGYGDLAFQFGLIDEHQKTFIDSQTEIAVTSIQKKDFKAAFLIFDILLNGDIYPYPTYFYNATGSTNYYNIMRQEQPPEFDYYLNFINQPSVRKNIHVGNLSYGSQSEEVEIALMLDIMDTVRDWLSVLMDNYKVLIYNGQLDLIVGGPLTERFLQVLQWSGTSAYLKADRKVWKINDDLAGYIRVVNNFYQVIVRGGGHILPFDQPERTFNLIQMFVSGEIDKFSNI